MRKHFVPFLLHTCAAEAHILRNKTAKSERLRRHAGNKMARGVVNHKATIFEANLPRKRSMSPVAMEGNDKELNGPLPNSEESPGDQTGKRVFIRQPKTNVAGFFSVTHP